MSDFIHLSVPKWHQLQTKNQPNYSVSSVNQWSVPQGEKPSQSLIDIRQKWDIFQNHSIF